MATQLRGNQIISATIPSSALIATDIATVGTITTGAWHADPVAVLYGGTGATSALSARSNLGLALGSDVQAWSANLDHYALHAQVQVADGGTGSTTASGARSNLGLVIGTDVQAYDAALAAVAAGTWAGDSSISTVGTITSGVWTGTKLGANYVPNIESLNVGGDVNLGSNKISSSATPSSGNDLVNKTYADSLSTGIRVKDAVRVASTGNLTLSGTQTIDGVALVAGDRVLAKNQTSAKDNGIYVVAAGAWSRSTDADSSAEVQPGMAVFVSEGTTTGNQQYVLITDAPITLGSTALQFTQFSGLGQISVGNGLSKTGNQIDLVLDGATLSKSGSGLKVASSGITSTELANNSVTASAISSGALSYGLAGASGNPIHVQMSIETPSGSINGSNTSFTLANTPGPATTQVFLNGLQQVGGVDYTISSGTITMNAAPVSGDSLRAVYFY